METTFSISLCWINLILYLFIRLCSLATTRCHDRCTNTASVTRISSLALEPCCTARRQCTSRAPLLSTFTSHSNRFIEQSEALLVSLLAFTTRLEWRFQGGKRADQKAVLCTRRGLQPMCCDTWPRLPPHDHNTFRSVQFSSRSSVLSGRFIFCSVHHLLVWRTLHIFRRVVAKSYANWQQEGTYVYREKAHTANNERNGRETGLDLGWTAFSTAELL